MLLLRKMKRMFYVDGNRLWKLHTENRVKRWRYVKCKNHEFQYNWALWEKVPNFTPSL